MLKPAPTNIKKGALVFSKPNEKGEGKLYKVLKSDSSVSGEVEKVDDNWFKVKDKEEYIHKKHLKVTKELKDDVVISEPSTYDVKNVDFDIKAGSIIGNAGKYAKKNSKWYNAAHLEVFTADSRFESFLKNEKEDGENACLLYTSPSPRDQRGSRMPSSA